MIFRVEHIVTHELHRLSIHDWQMLVLHHRISEMLMHELTKCSPLVAVMHDQEVVPLCNEIMRDERGRPMVVQCAFFVNRLFDNATVGDDSHCPIAYF